MGKSIVVPAQVSTVIPAQVSTVIPAQVSTVIPAQAGTSMGSAERLFMASPNITAAIGGPGLRRDDGA